jgi:hypothetical protein|tara:strand:+ start:804 stop:944 length:141 start_codon:yes stop_codon:yes gene_type:complete
MITAEVFILFQLFSGNPVDWIWLAAFALSDMVMWNTYKKLHKRKEN